MAPSNSKIPELTFQSPAVDFIDNRLDSYHRGFATPPAAYDQETGDFFICVSEPPIPGLPREADLVAMDSVVTLTSGTDMRVSSIKQEDIVTRPLAQPAAALRFWDSLFAIAMQEFSVKYPSEPDILVQAGRRIRNKTGWVHLWEQLELSKNEYCKVDKGFKAKFRKVYRGFGDKAAQPLREAAKFVPDIDYVTPVLGAVEILLEAARNAAKVREDLMNGFDDIDTIFSQVELFLDIFHGDKNIEQASVKLICAVFNAIECVIGFFVSKTWKRFFSATFKGKGYQESITDSLQAIKTQSLALILEADNSEKYELNNVLKSVLKIGMGQDQLLHASKTMFNRLIREFNANRVAYLKSSEASARREDQLMNIIQTLSRSPSPAVLGTAPSSGERYVDPQEILEWINIPDLTTQDLSLIQERGALRVPPHERARAEQLINLNKIQQWIVSPTSCQLLIHGDYESTRHVSGLSLFCSSLYQSLEDKPHIIRLAFFCGLHTASTSDEYTGAGVMLLNFICQLLCQHDFEGRIPSAEILEELVILRDIEELCRLFECLISLLPEDVVIFCLVDGILYYEREEFRDDMAYILVTILRMSDEQSTPAALKVLVTSPSNTMDVRRPFPPDLIVSMGGVNMPGMVSSKQRLERMLQGEMYNDLADSIEC